MRGLGAPTTCIHDSSGAGVVAPSTPIRVMGLPCPGTAPERYVPDTGRARLELGLRELVPLEDALRRTAEWHTPAALSNGIPRPQPARETVGAAV